MSYQQDPLPTTKDTMSKPFYTPPVPPVKNTPYPKATDTQKELEDAFKKVFIPTKKDGK